MEHYVTSQWPVNHNRNTENNNKLQYIIDIYGWRKRCLYICTLLLFITVIINLGLTLWVIIVMDFSTEGMGKLRILTRGLILDGEAEFQKSIFTTRIKSRKDADLKIVSDQNLTLSTWNREREITSSISLGPNKIESVASEFTIRNQRGKKNFHSTDDKVEILANVLNVIGSGGVSFQGSLQTPIITTELNSNLKIESPTRSLAIEAPMGIALESFSGGISTSCIRDLKLQSTGGAIRLDAENIILEKLPEAVTSSYAKDYTYVYQLCACDNGRLFLAPSDGQCFADITICK